MKRSIISRLLAIIVLTVFVYTSLPIEVLADDEDISAYASFETLRFDFGSSGTEAGYIGVSASELYESSKGYGFRNTSAVENVQSSGTGALSDAVQFLGVDGHVFDVDLPVGVYKITVTTGDVVSTTIEAEGISQLFFLTGNNATDSFTIPVTDGQLNIYPSAGMGGVYSLSTLEIEQVSTVATAKPTIWIVGDTTVASYYNVSADSRGGWGQFLGDYVDTNKYDIRNISIKDITAEVACAYPFETAEYYGKSDDIMLISVGFDDYLSHYDGYTQSSDSSEYVEWTTEMIRRSKNIGMTVYLVKQQGVLKDCSQYPLITSKWYSNEIDELAGAQQVGIIDLFHSWLEFCLENTSTVATRYYVDDVYINELGARQLARMVGEQLFPYKAPVVSNNNYTIDTNTNFDTVDTVVYQTEVSGGPVANPHKGYIMSVDDPAMFSSEYQYGIGGALGNQAWKLTTICSGAPRWENLNPSEGVYDWTEIDDMLDICEKYGMTYGIRIMPYSSYEGDHKNNYGEEHDFVPDWVYKKGAKKVRVSLDSDPSVQIDVPKWDDPYYLQACKDFATALAEHYDGDPRVEFIDIRTFGDWGEWHFAASREVQMPSLDKQIDMVNHYRDVFDETLLCITSDAYGEIYEYTLSLGITKRDDGLVGTPNVEWGLRLAYKANQPTLGENYLPYRLMHRPDLYGTGPVKNYDDFAIRWSPERFRETIEIAHLSMFQLDQDSSCGYFIYNEQKDVVEEMCNRLGYNFTVTSAKRNGNTLQVTVKNTGLAAAYFDIDLCAEITDASGNKLENFGNPIRIEKGTFRDEMEQTFVFEYNGSLNQNATICLSMYESDNPLVSDKEPTVRFDNKNTLPNNKLKLIKESGQVEQPGFIEGYSLDIKNGDYFFNIYTDIRSKYSSSGNYSIRIDLPDETVADTKVSEAVTANIGGKNYQVFTVNIPAKDMYKTVHIALYNSSGQSVGDSVDVSLYDYASALKKRNTNYADFIDAMLRYGIYAQSYFYNIDNSSMVKQYTATDYAAIAGKITARAGISTDGYIGSSLLLKNQVILRHYFDKPVAGSVKSGEYYYVEKAFNPNQFDSFISGYNYSVNDYIKRALSSSSDTKLKNLMCALYEYEVEARKIKY